MGFSSGYRGIQGGSVQTAYTDQPGVGVPGMLPYASDNVLMDNMLVNEANGIAAGRGVVRIPGTADIGNLQRPHSTIKLPDASTIAGDFVGIVLFDEAMQSDSNGVPGWADGRNARVLRPHRAGGRVYVKAKQAIALMDAVYMVTIAPTDASYAAGEFCTSSLGGGSAGTSVHLTNARWETAADSGDVAIMELLGDYVTTDS